MTKNNICDCRWVQNIFSQWSKRREKKKNLVWKKKYCEVLLGNPLIWNTDREKCATRFIWSPKNCLCSMQGSLF